MKFGTNLPIRGPLANGDNLLFLAQKAESLGFDSVTVSDHIVLPKVTTGNYPYHPEGRFDWQAAKNWYDPLTVLTFLAAGTKKIRLGTSVLIATYRNPVHTAKVLSSLDNLSAGRLFVGVGTGWWKEEYEALGLGDHHGVRGARTDEILQIFRELWEQAAPGFAGKYYEFGNIEFSPKPLQEEGIPIWIGGHTARALRRAVAFGQQWHPIGLRPPAGLDPTELGRLREKLIRFCEEGGRNPESLGIAFRCPANFSESSNQLLSGSPAQWVEDLAAYHAVGVGHITLDFQANSIGEWVECMEKTAELVMPHVP